MNIHMDWFDEHGLLISTFAGYTAIGDFREWSAALIPLLETLPPLPGNALYHIVDIQHSSSDFATALTYFRENLPEVMNRELPHEIEVLVVLVGTHATAQLFSTLARQPQFLGIELPMFPTMEAAHAFIAVDRARRFEAQNVTS